MDYGLSTKKTIHGLWTMDYRLKKQSIVYKLWAKINNKP